MARRVSFTLMMLLANFTNHTYVDGLCGSHLPRMPGGGATQKWFTKMS
jgi:hypothetical protein